ncbi:type III secretion system inner membrane ring lipoprotein SctJ [Sulfitobacter sp. 20_GPM-1509m]|uniref:type III secretion system inner membrane ring lipoprotein SctJ n=1 Tax=Sulfitobacter sp. 20_GPM-1509m TaxID=1380367 RepID=UPI000688258D|nr:type III secretion inner membrane ring lipoprotein SctJ [Sulfitobacter sp. 20_GPM-1509m]
MLRISFKLRFILALFLSFALLGCKEPLYSGLDESQANEMVAALQAANIEAGRLRDKDGLYTVTVLPNEVGIAVTLLRREGYPRPQFATLGDVFPDAGIVGTPFEERARFMYALNEELSHTVSEIAGIRNARVQVMIPPSPRYGDTLTPSSAAVAVHYEDGFDAAPLVPVIKSLIAHAVPNLEYDQVEVALFVAAGTRVPVPAPDPEITASDKGQSAVRLAALGPINFVRIEVLLAVAALLVLALGIGAFIHGIRSDKRR